MHCAARVVDGVVGSIVGVVVGWLVGRLVGWAWSIMLEKFKLF